MAYRRRINYTAQQKSEMWDRWQRGESLKGTSKNDSLRGILSLCSF